MTSARAAPRPAFFASKRSFRALILAACSSCRLRLASAALCNRSARASMGLLGAADGLASGAGVAGAALDVLGGVVVSSRGGGSAWRGGRGRAESAPGAGMAGREDALGSASSAAAAGRGAASSALSPGGAGCGACGSSTPGASEGGAWSWSSGLGEASILSKEERGEKPSSCDTGCAGGMAGRVWGASMGLWSCALLAWGWA